MTTAIGSEIWIVNNGTTTVDLSGMTLRYYLTITGEVPIADLSSSINWAHTAPLVGGSQTQYGGITIAAVAITPAVTGADTYLEFTLGSTTLPPSYDLNFSWVTQNFDSLKFNQTNDYSFNGAATAETVTQTVVLLNQGQVVVGTPP
jgi:hypothetical protein